MRSLSAMLLALSIIAGVAAPASAACSMDRWSDGAGAAPRTTGADGAQSELLDEPLRHRVACGAGKRRGAIHGEAAHPGCEP